MDRDALRTAALRYGLLFAISMILVAGFWFHSEFYQIGFVPLVLVGGAVTFCVLLALRALQQGRLWRARPRGSLPFTREAAERVLSGTQTLAILPVDAAIPTPGSVARAMIAATGQPVANVRVRDVRRRLAGDVRDAEAAAAGFEGADAFRKAWSRGRHRNPRDLVAIVEFRREAKG